MKAIMRKPTPATLPQWQQEHKTPKCPEQRCASHFSNNQGDSGRVVRNINVQGHCRSCRYIHTLFLSFQATCREMCINREASVIIFDLKHVLEGDAEGSRRQYNNQQIAMQSSQCAMALEYM
eukprot:1158359-Pelagomonas_calceolata.AAC.1